VRAIAEYGLVRFTRGADATPPESAVLSVPGTCRFGDWELECVPGPQPPAHGQGSLDEPVLDASRLSATLTVRAWRDGDRMRPLGLGGSKSLQDVFSDRKVPRALRRSLPVVVSGDDIAWVAGVAVSDLFKVDERTSATMCLRARTVAPTI
jgi:tRNA(Ile)-lysidine synthase